MSFLAFDIGGANLKVSDGVDYAASRKLAMWREADQLEAELRTMIANAPALPRLAITMTAELADGFASKREGVCAVLDAVEAAADGRPVRVYRNDGKLVAAPVIRANPLAAAATNWHALARYAVRWADVEEGSLLVDVGSSTCDVIWLSAPDKFPVAATDTERLATGQLVYVGVARTPVCSLVTHLPYRDEQVPIARELFATTIDVALLLGQIAEDPANTDTADGKPLSKSASRLRMSRMLCAPEEDFNHRDSVLMAEAVYDAQIDLVREGIERVVAAHQIPRRILFSGQGETLARDAFVKCDWDCETMSLSSQIGSAASRCAPAFALAVLAREGAEQN